MTEWARRTRVWKFVEVMDEISVRSSSRGCATATVSRRSSGHRERPGVVFAKGEEEKSVSDCCSEARR